MNMTNGMKKSCEARLTAGPVNSALLQLTLPMLLSSLSMVIFNITDTFFIGRLGTQQLAALSFTFPVVLFATSCAHGVGAGVSAVVSHAFGEKNPVKVKRVTTDGLILAFLLVSMITYGGLASIESLFQLLGASSAITVYIKEYMQIWYWGIFFMVVPMVANNAIRASGDTKTPGLIVLCAATLNIILDPILIFGLGPIPQLGVSGAAIATVASRTIMFLIAFYVLAYKKKMLSYTIPSADSIRKSWGEILFIGLPSIGVKMALPFATGILTSIIAAYGPKAVAGFGVATRIEAFTLMVILSLAAATGLFVGQNYGAGKFSRIRLGIQAGYQFSLAWGFMAALVLACCGEYIGAFFSDDPTVTSVVGRYLLLVPIGYGAYGLLVIATTAMSVLKKPLHATLVTLTQTFIVTLPLAYLGSTLFGLWGTFLALSISYCIVGICSRLLLEQMIIRLESDRQIDD